MDPLIKSQLAHIDKARLFSRLQRKVLVLDQYVTSNFPTFDVSKVVNIYSTSILMLQTRCAASQSRCPGRRRHGDSGRDRGSRGRHPETLRDRGWPPGMRAGPSARTITAGNGNDAALAGSNDTITLGNGTDVVVAGDSDTITLGNGADTVTAGTNSIITLGTGSDNVTAGSDSTIKLGNGSDTVTAGANSIITVGNGADSVTAGANSTITLGNGTDTVAFGESPNPLAIGNETINGFNAAHDGRVGSWRGPGFE